MPESLYCAMANHGMTIKTTGQLSPCCQYPFADDNLPDPANNYRNYHAWKTTQMHELSTALEQGIQVKQCKQCWIDEELGQGSLRQFANKIYPIQKTSSEIKHVELRLGNYCNLKCIMCSPDSSSSIETEYVQNKKLYDDRGFGWSIRPLEKYWETEEFDQLISQVFDQVVTLHFTGGEPLIVPQMPQILDRVQNKSQVSLKFVSNMTKINDRLIEKFRQFKSVEMSVSLEGVGAHNNYVRFPSQFEDIESNIDYLQTHLDHISFSINHVYQITSIYALPNLARWCSSKGLPLHFSPNWFRSEFSLQAAPPADLDRFKIWATQTQDLTNENRMFVLNSLKNVKFDPELCHRFQSYTNLLDSIRGTNYDQTFQPTRIFDLTQTKTTL